MIKDKMWMFLYNCFKQFSQRVSTLGHLQATKKKKKKKLDGFQIIDIPQKQQQRGITLS